MFATAGSRPPLLILHSLAAGLCSIVAATRSVYRAHSGLTPAALVNVRFVHRENRFFTGKRSLCTKSGGRKPPVVSQMRLQARFQHITDNIPPATPTAG
jgi:hypothetical protein